MTSIISIIIDFFKSIFGGNKSASTDATVQQTTNNEIKTDETMFRTFMVRGEDAETIDTLWNEAKTNEQNGIYDYKLTGKLAWYHIQNGQLIGNGAIGK